MLSLILLSATLAVADDPNLMSIQDMVKADPTTTCSYEKGKEQCGVCARLVCRNSKGEEYESPDKKCDLKECVSKVKRN